MSDPLRYTFEDARRQQLRDGIALSTAAKVAWFEEMAALALRFGAKDWLAERSPCPMVDDRMPCSGKSNEVSGATSSAVLK